MSVHTRSTCRHVGRRSGGGVAVVVLGSTCAWEEFQSARASPHMPHHPKCSCANVQGHLPASSTKMPASVLGLARHVLRVCVLARWSRCSGGFHDLPCCGCAVTCLQRPRRAQQCHSRPSGSAQRSCMRRHRAGTTAKMRSVGSVAWQLFRLGCGSFALFSFVQPGW